MLMGMGSTPGQGMDATSDLRVRLRDVRFVAGGTGAGKSTVAAALARRFGLEILGGDRAERDWVLRSDPAVQPRLAAMRDARPGDLWRGRTAVEVFHSMASLHGETTAPLVEDLLALPPGGRVLVDWFGLLPRDLLPLLERPTRQAVFLLPTATFRRAALTRRYADAARARANWGGLDPAAVLELRLERDALWDAEVRRQAGDLGMTTLEVGPGESPEALVERVRAVLDLADPEVRAGTSARSASPIRPSRRPCGPA